VLAQAIGKIGDFRIILCGKQASDGDTAQVGPGISTHLDIPQVTYVKKIEDIDEHRARVERMTEEGFEIVETLLPCLFTVVKEINEPRLPSLKGKMRARKMEIVQWDSEDINCDFDKIGLDGSPTRVVRIFTPPPRKGGEILKGDVHEIVDKLADELKKEL
jgi:electron transfer flavoprotein beta subunit